VEDRGAHVLVHTGDEILSGERASVPLLDHGFLFGDSVYDVVRTANRRPFMLEEHMDRLRRSAAMIYFDLPWSDDEVRRRVAELTGEIGKEECYFRLVATRGPGPISLLPDGCDAPALYVIGRELIRFPGSMYTGGCRVAVVRRLRNDPRALDPRAKTGNYLNNMLGLIEAKRAGADDALFLNAEEHLTEATTSNVWIVEKGEVVTPPTPEGLLPGITRDWAFATLPGAGIRIVEETIDRPRLSKADEVFLSGTVKGIMPVTMIDGGPVGDSRPGPLSRRAEELYREALARN
jgi:branched-chain amino acid aminotransferase